ncbi:uncharacterized protein LOC113291307 [Papaver somniferum]|uniref:uncharacterized protein LOC113291307 n=1 Tax=Papaver somniferum TaxID=3469 RepID=UPI000E6F7F15|nr:uncharacterized protein LOC113291307 [Papaver somniferum]
MCRGHILNALGLNVYNAHRTYGTAKDLWTALENKYKISEASNKKFLICNFMDWKMVDSKSIIDQISDLLLIVNHLKDAGIDLVSSFIVGVIISRLPPSWNSYKKELKHAETDYDLEGLQCHLRIEEDARKRETKDSQQTENHSKINNVQESETSNSLKVQNDSQFKKQYPNKNGKKKGPCYFSKKPDHIARDCRQKKKQMNKEANMVDDSKLVIVVQEANTVADHGSGWWYDTGATIHICKYRNLYKTYEHVVGEDVIYANRLPSKVHGKGTVELKFTSRKIVTLTNVLHVPYICKNLVSRVLVNKAGFEVKFGSDKFVLSKNVNDIGDLKSHVTHGGHKYYVIFIENSTIYSYTYLMKSKDEVVDKFRIYKAEVKTQLEQKIKVLRSDRGGEYYPTEFTVFCQEHGLIHEFTAPYTPQQNGIAERNNRTLIDMVNAILISSGLLNSLWGEAMLSACYILNRVPLKKKKVSPYELWLKRKPNLKRLKAWGCLAYVRKPDPKGPKLGNRAYKCVFVGYSLNSITYRCLILDTFEIIESVKVEFFESMTRTIPTEDIELRKSKRGRIEKNPEPEFKYYLVEGDKNEILSTTMYNMHDEGDPKTYAEAISSRDANFWKEAINDEKHSHLTNGT